MELITREQFALLLLNGSNYDTGLESNAKPVVKLIDTSNSDAWLLTSVDSDDPDSCYCLYIPSADIPKLKNISIEEISNYQHPIFGATIEREVNWIADKTLNDYYLEAQQI